MRKHAILLLILFYSPHLAHAQPAPGFDCAKAATPIENIICSEDKIASLDKQLSDKFAAAKSAHPQQTESLVQNQRQWLNHRGTDCNPDVPNPTDARRGAYINCLTAQYQDHLYALDHPEWWLQPQVDQTSRQPETSCAIHDSGTDCIPDEFAFDPNPYYSGYKDGYYQDGEFINLESQDLKAGRVGIAQPDKNTLALIMMYRVMAGLGIPEYDNDKQRKSDKAEYQCFSIKWNDTGYLNDRCSRTLACKTFMDYEKRYGKDSPFLKEWKAAQDQVFANCGIEDKDVVLPPPITDNASYTPEMQRQLRYDRAYQTASAYFYAKKYDEATSAFNAITKDKNSPYVAYSTYMLARVARDQEDYAQAEAQIKAILTNPQLSAVYDITNELLDSIAVSTNDNFLLRQKLKIILSNILQPADSIDYKYLKKQVFELHYYLLIYDKSLAEDERKENEFLDWFLSFRTHDNYATAGQAGRSNSDSDLSDVTASLNHALEKWEQTKSPRWLMVVMSKLPPSSTRINEMLFHAKMLIERQKAKDVSVEEKTVYPTVAFYAARLMIANGDSDGARAMLDQLLSKADILPKNGESEKRIRLLELSIARNVDEFMQLADIDLTRQRPKQKSEERTEISESASEAIDLLPIHELVRVAHLPALSLNLRSQVALLAWTRAVLLERYQDADAVVPVIMEGYPELVALFQDYSSAWTTSGKKHAALYLILHTPAIGLTLEHMANQQHEPMKEIGYEYAENWWCKTDSKQTAIEAKQHLIEMNIMQGLPYVASGSEWSYTDRIRNTLDALAAKHPVLSLANDEELNAIDTIGNAPDYLLHQVMAWASPFSFNPKAPEALHLAIYARRYGCRGSNDDVKAAFRLLHHRYWFSKWSKQTPYWYR